MTSYGIDNIFRKKLRDLQQVLNSKQCPDCGGLHLCRLSLRSNNRVLVEFDEGYCRVLVMAM